MKQRKLGDRKDGTLIRDIDSMHYITPQLYPNRTDNEAFVQEVVDLTKTNAFIRKKNEENPEFRYTVFQIVVAAILKVIVLRPKMNRFIANKKYYQRNEISASFIIKQHYNDDSGEGEAFIRVTPDQDLQFVHDEIYRQVRQCRSGAETSTDTALRTFQKMPGCICRFLVRIIRVLDKIGKVPRSFISEDPYYASVLLSNLGSIKLRAGYHHLTNWGTTSMFITVGSRELRPFYDSDGNMTMRDSIDLGLTLDERLADGFYYSKAVRMLKKYIENPEYLEIPFSMERLPKSTKGGSEAED